VFDFLTHTINQESVDNGIITPAFIFGSINIYYYPDWRNSQ